MVRSPLNRQKCPSFLTFPHRLQNQGAGKLIQTFRAMSAVTDQAESITGRFAAMAARVSSREVSDGGLCTLALVITTLTVLCIALFHFLQLSQAATETAPSTRQDATGVPSVVSRNASK